TTSCLSWWRTRFLLTPSGRWTKRKSSSESECEHETRMRPGRPNPRFNSAPGSVLRHGGVDLVAPRPDAARKVGHSFITLLTEELGNALRAPAAFAVDHDFALTVDVGQAVGYVVLRDQLAADLGNLRFPRLAHVDELHIFAGIDPALQFLHTDLRDSVFQVGFLLCRGGDAAELLIVDELSDSRIDAADRALGVLAELEFAETHIQRVNEQKPPDQRLAFAEDELDHLGRLHHAHEPRQNAEHAAF